MTSRGTSGSDGSKPGQSGSSGAWSFPPQPGRRMIPPMMMIHQTIGRKAIMIFECPYLPGVLLLKDGKRMLLQLNGGHMFPKTRPPAGTDGPNRPSSKGAPVIVGTPNHEERVAVPVAIVRLRGRRGALGTLPTLLKDGLWGSHGPSPSPPGFPHFSCHSEP